MNKLMIATAVAVLGISMAEAAPLYECGGDPACQAKRDSMSRSTYEKNINRCLASAGATREQCGAKTRCRQGPSLLGSARIEPPSGSYTSTRPPKNGISARLSVCGRRDVKMISAPA